MEPKMRHLERIGKAVSFDGLTVDYFDSERHQAILEEWGPEQMNWHCVPPLGVVVSDGHGPCVACWVLETVGLGLAILRFALARPGLMLADSRRAFGFAVGTLMDLAGQRFEPPGEFKLFQADVSPGIGRILAGFGFSVEKPQTLVRALLWQSKV